MTTNQNGQPGASEGHANGGEHTKGSAAPPDAVFGQVVWLMMNMRIYRHVFVTAHPVNVTVLQDRIGVDGRHRQNPRRHAHLR